MSDLAEHVKEVEKFEKSNLSKTDTMEKGVLPDADGNYLQKIYLFLKIQLNQQDFFRQKYMMINYFLVIKAEKNEQKHRAGIEKFDKAELRKSQTVEKNPLPTKEDIEAEKEAN